MKREKRQCTIPRLRGRASEWVGLVVTGEHSSARQDFYFPRCPSLAGRSQPSSVGVVTQTSSFRRIQNPNWVGEMMNFLIDFAVNPPALMIGPLIATGLLLIWWDVKRHSPRPSRFRSALNSSLINNPEHVKRSAAYIALIAHYEPNKGNLSPGEKINQGNEEFQTLYEQAFNSRDYETYLIVGHMAEWLRENSQHFWGSSTSFHETLALINARIQNLEQRFRGASVAKLPRFDLRVTGTSSSYLSGTDVELGIAIQMMGQFSAWGRWFAAQHIAANDHTPIAEINLMHAAAHEVLEAAMDGKLKVRGRPPVTATYEDIPREMWRLATLDLGGDPKAFWRVSVVPRDKVAPSRIRKLLDFDSLIVLLCHKFLCCERAGIAL